jgi:hypothetical protein
MKDVASKLTFGFLMAQLFPGAVAVFAVSFAYFSYQGQLPGGALVASNLVLRTWNDAPIAHQLFLLGLCIGFGMLIHGINWAVLGALENGGKVSIFRSRWHKSPVAAQILLAPFRLVFELLQLLFIRGGIEPLSIEENVPRVDDKLMKQHEFLQDFYLYPAQFFAHTAYALLVLQAALFTFVFQYGFTWRRMTLAAIIYFGISAFFTLARCQLVSLFRGEKELLVRSAWLATGVTESAP